MRSTADDNFFADHGKYLLAALVLHVVIAVLLTVTMRATTQSVVPQLAIKGVMIDNTAKRLKREQAEAQQKAREEAERIEAENAAAEQRAREQAEQERKQREQQAQLEAKQQEQRRAKEKRQQQVADQKRKADSDKREQQKQAVAKKAADDKKRAADIKAKQEEKQREERDAREQAQRENELKRQLADEEGRMQAENSGLLNQYAALIEQRVVRNWNKPASARPGIQCDVKVTQAPGGTVLSVQIDKCNGDSAVRQSIEAAVYRSSPLPPPPDARLFQRVIVFVFKPAD